MPPFTRSAPSSPLLIHGYSSHLLFVDQPLHRDIALNAAVGEALSAWSARPPIIIDESDGALDSLPTALARGYSGTSHKNCKGVFKGIANACLVEHLRRTDAIQGYASLDRRDFVNLGCNAGSDRIHDRKPKRKSGGLDDALLAVLHMLA